MNVSKTVYFVPHTHWDREWYLTQKQFQFRLQSAVSDLLDAMEAPKCKRIEKFTLDGQTVILEDLLSWQPGLRPRIARLIRAGRLEIGPWYTMPDLWLPTPEALHRNLERGRRDCLAWGMPRHRFVYVPDSFGMPAGVPGLLRIQGFEAVVFGRSQPLSLGSNPVDFRWTNPDGTNPVLAISLPNGYTSAALLPAAEDHCRLRAWLNDLIKAHSHKALPNLIGAFNGIDHIRVQRDLPEIIAALRQLFPQHKFVQATLSEFVQAVIGKMPKAIPAYSGSFRGKLRPWELNGTWSARQDLKFEDHYCSALLKRADALCSKVVSSGCAFLRGPLEEAWNYLLLNQAHDSICGCSPDPVADDQRARYRWIRQLATDVIEEALRTLARKQFPTSNGVIFSPPESGSLLGLAEISIDSSGGPVLFRGHKGTLRSQLLRSESLERRDVCLAYSSRGPFKEIQTRVRRHHWLVEPAAGNLMSFAEFAMRTGHRLDSKRKAPALSVRDVTRLITNLEIVQDVGGLYAHVPRGRPQLWVPRTGSQQLFEKGPLRWSYRLRLQYPSKRFLKHPFNPAPADLQRDINIQLFPNLPVAIIDEIWSGNIEFARIRLPLPFQSSELIVRHDELDQTRSYKLPELARVPAVAPSDRSFFFRSWLQLRPPNRAPLTIFGNGLHEFGLASAPRRGLGLTLWRPQGYVQLCGDWPAPRAQLPAQQTMRFAMWWGEISDTQCRAFSAELVVPFIAEPTQEYEPKAVRQMGHATTYTRTAGRPVSDAPKNWRTVSNHRSGWRPRID